MRLVAGEQLSDSPIVHQREACTECGLYEQCSDWGVQAESILYAEVLWKGGSERLHEWSWNEATGI